MRRRIAATVAALLPLVAHASCFEIAASEHHVNPTVLKAIALRESSFNPRAVNKNKNGTRDLGLMQINTIHLPVLNKFGIHKRDLMNACTSIQVAAWLLRQKIDKYGNTWAAVGAYHSETPPERDAYARLIRQDMKIIKSGYKINLAGI